jgi:hypothetical protein
VATLSALVTGITISVALLAAVFTAIQGFAARNQARSLQVQLLMGLNQDWRSLREAWAISLMLIRGSSDFYTRATMEARYAYVVLREMGHFGEYSPDPWSMSLDVPDEYRTRVSELSVSEQQLQAQRLIDATEDVVAFLQRTCGRVLSGELQVATLYEACGPAVVQNARPLRELAKEHRYSWYYPGMSERILILIDLLWAHAVRLGEVGEENLSAIAAHKRATGSGLTNRLRVRRAARRHGGRLVASRLEYLLCYAETRKRSRMQRIHRFLVGGLVSSRI